MRAGHGRPIMPAEKQPARAPRCGMNGEGQASTLTRRSLLRSSVGLAAAGALARPYIAHAAATTVETWWNQGFIPEEDAAFRAMVADYEKASGRLFTSRQRGRFAFAGACGFADERRDGYGRRAAEFATSVTGGSRPTRDASGASKATVPLWRIGRTPRRRPRRSSTMQSRHRRSALR